MKGTTDGSVDQGSTVALPPGKAIAACPLGRIAEIW